MKQFVLWIIVVGLCATLFAVPVTAPEAMCAAQAFIQKNKILSEVILGVETPVAWGGVWIVPLCPQGYLALNSDVSRPPVIGFSETSNFPFNAPPPALRALFFRFVPSTPCTLLSFEERPRHAGWTALLSPKISFFATEDVPSPSPVVSFVVPQFDFSWDQTLPYNLYAPAAPDTVKRETVMEAIQRYGARSAVGCVATSIGQVGAWFQWPYMLRGVVRTEVAGAKVARADEAGADEVFASDQTAAPGKPYDWATIAAMKSPNAEDPNGPELARFLQHWATLLEMNYDMSLSGGTNATCSRPNLMVKMGYKIVSRHTVESKLVWRELEGNYQSTETMEFSPEELSSLYREIKDGVFKKRIPLSIAIADHQIVGYGWARLNECTSFSADTCYAKLNYGWGAASGSNGWYCLREKDIGDGESVAPDGKVCLKECFAIVPLQCGQCVNLPKKLLKGATPTPSLTWYEAPYWAQQSAQRTLRCATVAASTTVSRELSLSDAAASDANWSYDNDTRKLSVDPRVDLCAAACFPELLRFDDISNGKLVLNLARTGISNADARPLRLYAIDPETGDSLLLGDIQLPEGENSGTQTVTIPLELKGKLFMLSVSSEPRDESVAFSIGIDSVACDITKVTAENMVKVTVKDYPLTPTPDTTTASLFSAPLPSEVLALTGECWFSVKIGTTTDALWSKTELTNTAPKTPPVFWLPPHVVLNTPDSSIPVSLAEGMAVDQFTWRTYVSNNLWLQKTARDGAAATIREMPGKQWCFILNADVDFMKTCQAVGKDAVFSVCAEDSDGNQTWAHTRLTYIQPRVAPYGSESWWTTAVVDKLLYVATTATTPHRDPLSAIKLIENASLFHYTPAEIETLFTTTPSIDFDPRIEILSMDGATLAFQFADKKTPSVELAKRSLATRLKVYAGDSFLSLQLQPLLYFSPTFNRTTGVYTLTLPNGYHFFRLVLE
ncbi:MAG: C10 family peptidase [Kiritimatiellia bacterium]